MNLRQALRVADKFVIYGEPNGTTGSFEPMKAAFNEEKKIWVVICHFTASDFIVRTVKVEIDDASEEIVGYEVLA